jgi:hypothetical protein
MTAPVAPVDRSVPADETTHIIANLTNQLKILQDRVDELTTAKASAGIDNSTHTHNDNITYNDNSTHNITIHNTININPFGNERIDHIENIEQYLKPYSKEKFMKIFNLIYDVPENENVRLRSHKKKEMEVYTNKGWAIRASGEVTNAMIQKTNDLGGEAYNKSPELQEFDANETDYATNRLLNNIRKGSNRDFYDVRERVAAALSDKKTKLEKA